MKRFITIIAITAFALLAAATFVVSLAANQAIEAYAEIAMQPQSAADLIITSRTTAPADRSNAGWLGAGLVALTLVGLGAVAFTMKGGTDFLKQWRLLNKKNKGQGQRPYATQLAPQPYNELPSIPTPRRLPALPTWSESDDAHYSN